MHSWSTHNMFKFNHENIQKCFYMYIMVCSIVCMFFFFPFNIICTTTRTSKIYIIYYNIRDYIMECIHEVRICLNSFSKMFNVIYITSSCVIIMSILEINITLHNAFSKYKNVRRTFKCIQ